MSGFSFKKSWRLQILSGLGHKHSLSSNFTYHMSLAPTQQTLNRISFLSRFVFEDSEKDHLYNVNSVLDIDFTISNNYYIVPKLISFQSLLFLLEKSHELEKLKNSMLKLNSSSPHHEYCSMAKYWDSPSLT